jgi:hypothetical protein
MRKMIVSLMLLLAALLAPGAPAAQAAQAAPAATMVQTATARAATVSTYGDFTRMFDRSAGKFANETQEWAWSPQSTVESQVYWGTPWTTAPPAYRERFVRDGDWVIQPGWFDNGTYYELRTITEWTANADCRTGKTFFAPGGSPHYAKWTTPATAYCLYVEATITEQLSGKSYHYIHQQLWSPPAACPKLPKPIVNLANQPVPVSDCITQGESFADDRGSPGVFTTRIERTVWLARGVGMAYRTVQTAPSAWSADASSAWTW